MQEEKEGATILELLTLMTEKMLRMERELQVLNEKQNGEINIQNDKGVQGDVGADSHKQISIAGL